MADPHPVLAALHQRRASGSRPGARDDRRRIALVIEGGGMRGVVSSAMAASIEAAGLLDAFDLVAGTSAGSLNAAALLGGVAAGCTAEYAGAFAGRGFINPARILVGRPVIDVGFVLHFSSDRLDAGRHARAVASPIELHCVATDVDRCAPVDLTGLRDDDDLVSALLASTRLPWIGGDPVAFRGRRWLDGGLCEPVPLPTATAAGATHVLVLLTRPRGERATKTGGLADGLVERRLRRLNPALVDAYRSRPGIYAEMTDGVVASTEAPAAAPPHVMGIWLPEDSPVPSRLERDPEPMRAAADLARRTADAALAA